MSEEDLLEMLVAMAPESLEGWLAIVVTISAFLSIILPEPGQDSHPLLRAGHRLVCIVGLGATKLRAAGKIGSIIKKGGRG